MSRFRNAPAAAPVATAATLTAGLAGSPADAGTAPSPSVRFRPPLRAGTRFPHAWPRQSLLELAAVPGSVPCARRHARQVLSEWNFGPLGELAELVVSELVTNAIRGCLSQGG